MRYVIGIRRETIDFQERRAPLTPAHVRRLVDGSGVDVLVEPCNSRVFSDDEYRAAGATLTRELSPACVIFGIKEIPPDELLAGKTYCFFSHTIKGQSRNMPMLARMLSLGATLIDYELIVNEKGRRLIAFGAFAGYAGMINTLWAFGQRLRWEGIPSVFERICRAKDYATLEDLKHALKDVGRAMKGAGLPHAIVPVVCGVTGQGRVARGALAMLGLLPTERVEPGELPRLFASGRFSNRVIYRVHYHQADIYTPRDPRASFDRYRLFRYPDRFRSLIEDSLHYLSILVNGIYWEQRFPRLVTKSALRALYERNPVPRLRVLGDITCDVDGSIESTIKATTVDRPTFVFDPISGAAVDGVAGLGPVVMAIDKLPTELPRQASESFGDTLAPFVPMLARADYASELKESGLPPELERAVVAHRGQLTPAWEGLSDLMK